MLLFVSSKHSLQGGAKSISSTEALLPQLQVHGPPGRCWVHVPCGSTSCSPLAGLDESPLLHKNVPWYTSISTKWISPVVRIKCSACPVTVTSFPDLLLPHTNPCTDMHPQMVLLRTPPLPHSPVGPRAFGVTPRAIPSPSCQFVWGSVGWHFSWDSLRRRQDRGLQGLQLCIEYPSPLFLWAHRGGP